MTRSSRGRVHVFPALLAYFSAEAPKTYITFISKSRALVAHGDKPHSRSPHIFYSLTHTWSPATLLFPLSHTHARNAPASVRKETRSRGASFWGENQDTEKTGDAKGGAGEKKTKKREQPLSSDRKAQ